MDTSETYIKMSDHPKIQGEWNPIEGDIYLCSGSKFFSIYSGQCIDFIAFNDVWLPRQDEIQKMMPQCNCSTCLIEEFYHFHERNIEGFFKVRLTSMEQLWLAFYMWEKHKLIWNGEKWEKYSPPTYRTIQGKKKILI